MPKPGEHREEVLRLADLHGWQRVTETTSHGAVSDQFTRQGTVLTLFWSRSVRSDAHWNTGLLEAADGPRQVWRITGDGGVVDVLRS